MRSTLFHIPAEFAGLPVFGIGWMLFAWLILSAAGLLWMWRKTSDAKEVLGYLPMLAIVALVIAIFLPMMMEVGADQRPLGVPIRGFGVMFMLATIAGVGLSAWRARQVGLDPEIIFSLAFLMVLAGLAGARLFFVIQYWDEFRKPTWTETGWSLLKFTEGGLVVYGSVLAGLPVGMWYLRRHGLPVLAVADIIAPGMILGAALGRIGCFLNGCCFGGECLPPDWRALSFPLESPPYKQQVESGWNSGVWLEARDGQVVVAFLAPGGAQAAGLKVGDTITSVNGGAVAALDDARGRLAPPSRNSKAKPAPRTFVVETSDGQTITWTTRGWPPRTVPIHPTQLYAALDAGLLALVLWFVFPYRRRDGEVFALLITVHPLSRFVLEMIRSDEQGWLGTPLTIAQWTSIAILAGAVALWWYIERQPPGCAYPSPQRAA